MTDGITLTGAVYGGPTTYVTTSTSGTPLIITSTGNTVPTLSIGSTNTMITSNGIAYCQPIETYAWSGLNFLFIAVGAAIIIGAATIAYKALKNQNG